MILLLNYTNIFKNDLFFGKSVIVTLYFAFGGVLGGMIAASSIAVFIVPVLFVVIVKIAYGKKKLAELAQQRNQTNPAT